ncbi:hypothetical protein HYH03_016394 [Edaphochlamys debaryana]|uniref:Uncharacterized protein n=1 Tax=Edaphochlamys debaryana TaxID=47281 RepID=A0A836BQB4_9CHLO|nr:hypothetical protein HYH03_016394 [Edaphochlamys debaryana]|eukprot:KAG2484827.1 hypothetical protein HYH03_016394 [Edaphochlamys debaryana]
MPFLRHRPASSHGFSDLDAFLDAPLQRPEPALRSPRVAPEESAPAGTPSRQPLRAQPSPGDFEAVVCELLLAEADVNERVSLSNANGEAVDGVTPLYLAAQAGHLEMCRLLLQRGADPRIRTMTAGGEAFSPADVALYTGNIRVWWMLRREAKKQKHTPAMPCRRPAPLPAYAPPAAAFAGAAAPAAPRSMLPPPQPAAPVLAPPAAKAPVQPPSMPPPPSAERVPAPPLPPLTEAELSALLPPPPPLRRLRAWSFEAE